jgi:serine/threonine protein kinase
MSSRDNFIPSIGDVLMGRYRIESFVARGGMGVVMRARQLSMDREVAIKMILPQYAENEKTLARFDREVHLAKQLRHPNIVELYDYGSTESGVLYLVMEFLEGEDLKTLLRRDGPMPIGRAGKITLQVLDALAEAHAQNIVHRDLKPSNIFVTRMRRLGDFAKLLDFGIAKSLAEDASEVTAQGEICGTSSYMAPEMFVQGTVGTTVDVYAMGLILLEMLLGKKVFSGQSSAETLVLHLRKDVVIPPPFAATNLSHVMSKALAKHPRARYANAVEFLEDLEPALDSLDGSMRIAPETIETYTQDLSEDDGLLDQVLAGPWATGMTEPDSGSSDIVVMPGQGADEPEEFEAAVTQLMKRAREDFVREEEGNTDSPSTPPPPVPPSDPRTHDTPPPAVEVADGSEIVGKDTVKMEVSIPAEDARVDEPDISSTEAPGAETGPVDGEFEKTVPMDTVPHTSSMTAMERSNRWWRRPPALVAFGAICVALFGAAVLLPLMSGPSDEKSSATREEQPAATPSAEPIEPEAILAESPGTPGPDEEGDVVEPEDAVDDSKPETEAETEVADDDTADEDAVEPEKEEDTAEPATTARRAETKADDVEVRGSNAAGDDDKPSTAQERRPRNTKKPKPGKTTDGGKNGKVPVPGLEVPKFD